MQFLYILTVAFCVSIVSGHGDCTSWENFKDCYRMAGCFWASEYGTCENFSDWTKDGNENSCLQFGNLGTCYDRVDCFWASRTGDCEFIGDWQKSGQVANHNMGAKESVPQVDTIKEKESTETNHEAETKHEPEPEVNHQPETNHLPEPEEVKNKQEEPESKEATAADNDLIFFFDQQSKAPYYSICSQFTNPRGCQESGEHCFWDEYACQYEYAPCQMFNTYQKCSSYNEDCLWSKQYSTCFSACNKLNNQLDCTENEDCVWHDETRNVHDFQCVAVSNCGNLYTGSDCMKNVECSWESRTFTCISIYSPCEFFSDEQNCNAQGSNACTFKNGSCVAVFSPNTAGFELSSTNEGTTNLNGLPAPMPEDKTWEPENVPTYNHQPAQEPQDEYGYKTESHNDGPNYNVPEGAYPSGDSSNRRPPNNYPTDASKTRPTNNYYPEETKPTNNYPYDGQNSQGGSSMPSGGSMGPSGGSLGPSGGSMGPTKEQIQRERIENYHSDCSMLDTEDDCVNVGEDCFWYTEFNKCHFMEAACYTYISQTYCNYNEDCNWNPLDNECQSPCSVLATKVDCIEEEEECFWQNRPQNGQEESCLPTNLPCNELATQMQCGMNIEACIWEELGDGCISVYSTCDKYKAEETCGMSTVFTCEWDEDLMICGQEKILLQKSVVEEIKERTNKGTSDVVNVNYIVFVVCIILILIGGICSVLHCLELHKKIGGDLYFLNNNLDVHRAPLILTDPKDTDMLYDICLEENSK